MDLHLWMKANRYTDAAFIKEINRLLVADGHKPLTWRAVLPWRTGVAIPRPLVIQAIDTFTGGLVKYEDHIRKNARHRKRTPLKGSGRGNAA